MHPPLAQGLGSSVGRATCVWDSLAPVGAPPRSRSGHAVAYDPIHERMILVGGAWGRMYGGSYQDLAYYNDAWTLSLGGSPQWDSVQVTGPRPEMRSMHSAVFDPTTQRVVMFGGYYESVDASAHGVMDGVWALRFVGAHQAVWDSISTSGAKPKARSSHCAIWDPVGNRMVVFGGWMPDTSGELSLQDVHFLTFTNLTTAVWSSLPVSGSWPGARDNAAAAYDPIRQRMLVFGGTDSKTGTIWGDTWALSLTGTPTWTQITADQPFQPSSRASHAAVYDSLRDRFVIHGGWLNYEPRGDLWALSLSDSGNPVWTSLTPSSPQPTNRFRHSAMMDPVGERMLVMDGRENTKADSDLWALRFPAARGSITGATGMGASQIRINWYAPSPTTNAYTLFRSRTATGGFVPIVTGSSPGSHPGGLAGGLTDSGLYPNSTYYYKFLALNSAGGWDTSAAAGATTSDTLPPPPALVADTTLSSRSVQIRWEAGEATGASATLRYVILRSLTATGGYTARDSVLASVFAYTDTAGAPNQTYFYRLVARNVLGPSDTSASGSATTGDTVLAAPLALKARAPSALSIALTWRPGPSQGASSCTGHVILRRDGSGGSFDTLGTSGTDTTYTDAHGLSPRGTYSYKVVAVNRKGYS
ncbi:MAG TPA: kelch repeat-containing protein, partial [Candidatus Saccharimonadales bacterium]|nr:kelch repeat-containing protein [Candidatus Saccharimonadales bacterium]